MMLRAVSAGILALALGAAADRSCHLWQEVDEDLSMFTHVSGVLNEKYDLALKGSWRPHISGKLMQTFDGGPCPASLGELEGAQFTLSSSAAEPIFLSNSEVKAGPASITLSRLTAEMDPSTFTVRTSDCKGEDLSGASFCFTGVASIKAINGSAIALGTPYKLAGARGDFHLSGFMDPEESELRMHFTSIWAEFIIDTKDVKGPFNLRGSMETHARLPYLFSLGLHTEGGAAPAPTATTHSPWLQFAAILPAVLGLAALAFAAGRHALRRHAAPGGEAGHDHTGSGSSGNAVVAGPGIPMLS